jgi:predicted nucleotidyltransferase
MPRRTLRLTRGEQEWLSAYRQALTAQFPGAVEKVLLYGSKARGDAGPESDLDVLLLVTDGAGGLRRAMRRPGYLLAAAAEVVPSIMACTRGEWDQRKEIGSSFRRNVERDGVRIPGRRDWCSPRATAR